MLYFFADKLNGNQLISIHSRRDVPWVDRKLTPEAQHFGTMDSASMQAPDPDSKHVNVPEPEK